MLSSRVIEIVESVRALGEPVRVTGVTSGSKAYLVARWALEEQRSVVVVCPDDDVANTLAGDLESLASAMGSFLPVQVFPRWEQSLYSPVAPAIRIRNARVAALESIQADRGPAVFITTFPAAVQATIPPEVLKRHTLSLAEGESVGSREELVGRLIEAGYLRVDPVEDPGTFSVRGDIVDVYPPHLEQPVRIELWGDDIERIRPFDPESQRAAEGAESLKRVIVPPAREVLINHDTHSRLRDRLKASADEAGIPRQVRDPVLESVREGIYPDHSDAWGPFTYEKTATFFEHLPDDWPIVVDDELGCQQGLDEFLGEQHRLEPDAPAKGLILPRAGDLFPWSNALEKEISKRTRLYLDRIELADFESVERPSDSDEETPVEGPRKRHIIRITPNSDLKTSSQPLLTLLEEKLQLWRQERYRVLVLAGTESQRDRIRYLLEERGIACAMDGTPDESVVHLYTGEFSHGFRWPAERVAVLTDSEVLGGRHIRTPGTKKKKRRSSSAARDWAGLQTLSDLVPGDPIVHVDHGIGRYLGLVRLDLDGAPADFLQIEYAAGDKLYLPVYRLNVIQKYMGGIESVSLDKLGSAQFEKTKNKVREAVRKLALNLVELYAERQMRQGEPFPERDAELREFEGKFTFDETPDQLKAIEDTLDDLHSSRIMDRLICGDVGFGKTEVAMRAAFQVVIHGWQVAVLVPTTVLAHQHHQSFKERFGDYPVRIESLSRFRSAKEQKQLLADLAEGKIDIIIGTHRLLSRDVRFKQLGLIVVDEEQRFGVEHKEKLKTVRLNTHVLTLTATPIPRTLHMAMAGLRDISLITTPPVDRLPIRTYVSKYDDEIIRRAVEFELARGGQVFFLHNRVQSIHEVAERVQELVPSARISVAHGQMAEGQLEKTMMAFYRKEADVLVCTTIIESGLDIPSANTIIVNRADTLGLAQLYQLRGRVGRSGQRAYAYLMVSASGALSDDAKRRLEVIQRFVELGSGFSIASHDLEIRGGGNLLGAEQSGHIASVGFDLYTQLLEEAILEIQGKPRRPEDQAHEPEIKAPFPAYLDESYIPDVHQRLSLYRRLSSADTPSEIDRVEEELRDRFGRPTPEAANLLWVIRIKQLLKTAAIDALTVGPEKIALSIGGQSRVAPERAIELVSRDPARFSVRPDRIGSRLIVKFPTRGLSDLFFELEKLVSGLTGFANP